MYLCIIAKEKKTRLNSSMSKMILNELLGFYKRKPINTQINLRVLIKYEKATSVLYHWQM